VIRRTASRFGVIADVHANLQALRAVLDYLESESVSEIWCLGDVVGYGGDPEACVALVRQQCAGTVRGNHDLALVEPRFRAWFNPHARAAVERQADVVSEETRRWLAQLPALIELGDNLLTHARADDPDGFPYILAPGDAGRELAELSARWTFYGHTHVSAAWRLDPEGGVRVESAADSGLVLDRPGRYLLNPGAVGQPRDGDARAACAVFEREPPRLEFVRVEYDVAAAQTAIRRARMPEIEAARLAEGR
jgi:diadenosine tetraphosphatase ApaH/serine/threonine PP2A family protein phosphatase